MSLLEKTLQIQSLHCYAYQPHMLLCPPVCLIAYKRNQRNLHIQTYLLDDDSWLETIYTTHEIERAQQQSPSFQGEYSLKHLGLIWKYLPYQGAIQTACGKGKGSNPYTPVSLWLAGPWELILCGCSSSFGEWVYRERVDFHYCMLKKLEGCIINQ